jgi:hypothetical protein
MLAERLLIGLHVPSCGAVRAAEWVKRLGPSLWRMFCSIGGHDLLLHFEPRRLSLRCANCGWESPGWTIAPSSISAVRQPVRAAGSRPPLWNGRVLSPRTHAGLCGRRTPIAGKGRVSGGISRIYIRRLRLRPQDSRLREGETIPRTPVDSSFLSHAQPRQASGICLELTSGVRRGLW